MLEDISVICSGKFPQLFHSVITGEQAQTVLPSDHASLESHAFVDSGIDERRMVKQIPLKNREQDARDEI